MTRLRAPRRGLLRGLSGVLTGGLVALAVVLVAGGLYAARAGLPGPGPVMMAGHGVAALVAVVAQVWVDRRGDRTGTLAAAGLAALLLAGLSVVWLR